MSEARLERRISLPLLVLYGLGTTVGAGIYALVGKVAGEAGSAAPFGFLIASLLAAPTAYSFAKLASRFPRSAGEAVYVREAFGARTLSTLTGLSVAAAGCVSAAAISNGFAGYLQGLVALPYTAAVAGVVVLLTAIAAWGVRESFWVAAIVTLLEVGGLLLIAWTARAALGDLPARLPDLVPDASPAAWAGVLSASLIAFYAFLGFEDMVNVAEEVQHVRRNMPIAIGVTLVVTVLLYALISTISVLSVPIAELAASGEPLTLIYRSAGGETPELISTIAVFAMLNGALVQVVMASRVLYGLAGEPGVPRALGRVHPRTHTPLLATGFAGGATLLLALYFPLQGLATATSLIILLVFTGVNAALLRVLWRESGRGVLLRRASWLPWCGLVFSSGFVAYSAGRLLAN